MGQMPDEAALPSSAPTAPRMRQCAQCSPGVYRRINRSTLLQRTVFTWLGFYPWECVCCRRRKLFRDAGRSGEAHPPQKP